MVHLCAGLEGVAAGPPRWRAQLGLAHPAREGRVGQVQLVFVCQHFVHAHHVAPAAGEDLRDQRQGLGRTRGRRVGRLIVRRRRAGPQDPTYGVARQPEQAADLAQRHALCAQRAQGLA